MASGQTIAAIALVGCVLASSSWYLLCLAAIGVGSGAGRAGSLVFSQTLAGPHATGKWTELQNGFANLSGVLLRRSPDFWWIGLESSRCHSRSLRQYWWLAFSRGCLWSGQSNK